MTITEATSLIAAIGAIVTPIFLALLTRQQNKKIDASAEDIKRLEVNTNSISERNEAIAKKLGIQEGIAREKANPS